MGSSAWAHHAFAAEFDETKPLQLHGKVVKMEGINPAPGFMSRFRTKRPAVVVECGPTTWFSASG